MSVKIVLVPVCVFVPTGGALGLFQVSATFKAVTVEPHYNEVLGTMKITLLYQVSHYIRVKKLKNIKSWDQQNNLVIKGFCYIRPLYNEVPLYWAPFKGEIQSRVKFIL